jgi:MFS family permease
MAQESGLRPSVSRLGRRRAVRLTFVGAFGGFTSFNLLLTAVPSYAVHSGAGPVAGGLTTGALMLGAVVVQPATPRLFAVLGRRRTLAAAGLLMGLPSLLLLLPHAGSPSALAVLALLRGLGFGVLVVAGVTITAELFPPDRRARALGLYGALTALAGIIGAPLGLALAGRGAYPGVFLLAAATALLVVVGAAMAPPVRTVEDAGPRRPASGSLKGVWRGLVGPFTVEAVSTTAYSVVFTFLPLTSGRDAPGWLAPASLLAVQLAAAVSRWGIGPAVDRYGGGRVLRPAVLVAAAGVAAGAVPDRPALVLVGMTLFGLGFGVIQNASLALVLDRARGPGMGVGSVVWNLAFDVGTGAGVTAGGLVLAAGGDAAVFLSASALLVASLLATRKPGGCGR